MYARQGPQGRFPRGMHIPQNYSGNAFRSNEKEENDTKSINENEENIEEAKEDITPKDDSEPKGESIPAGQLIRSPGFKLDLGRFFHSERGGIGFEELLIIGLIFLISQGESSDDLIFLLLLLLFIK